jgi:CheY-like chemotaxis protein
MTQTPGKAEKGVLRPEDLTVLVVDDEPDVAFYLGSVLEDAGLNVVFAHDGDEALAAIRRQPPDLISLDLVMPRKSGIRVLAELRRNPVWARIPVVIVTAHARDPEVRREVSEHADVLAGSVITGPSMYLEKPVTPQKYLRGICDILGVEAVLDHSGVSADSHAELRNEAKNLLEEVDAATLEEVLGRLRQRQI